MENVLKSDPMVMICIPFRTLALALDFASIPATAKWSPQPDIHLQVGRINGVAYVIGKKYAKS